MGLDLSPLWISIGTALLATLITFFLGIIVAYKISNYNGIFAYITYKGRWIN